MKHLINVIRWKLFRTCDLTCQSFNILELTHYHRQEIQKEVNDKNPESLKKYQAMGMQMYS